MYTDMEITGFCKQQQNQQKAENSMSTKPIENHRKPMLQSFESFACRHFGLKCVMKGAEGSCKANTFATRRLVFASWVPSVSNMKNGGRCRSFGSLKVASWMFCNLNSRWNSHPIQVSNGCHLWFSSLRKRDGKNHLIHFLIPMIVHR